MTESPTSTNSFIDGSLDNSSQFTQNNCRKRMRTLESEMDQTSMEMKLIKDKSDLQNSLMEQLNENKRLSDELEKSNIEKEKFKKENEKNLEEFTKLQNKHSEMLKDRLKVIGENTQLLLRLASNSKELIKLREESQKLTKINENICKEKNEIAKDLENLFKENEKLKEEKDLNLKESSIIVRKLKLNNSELTKCKNKLAVKTNLVRYVSLKNRINEINKRFTCCTNRCINSNLYDGTCIRKQGFIRVQDDGIVKYHLMENNENNDQIIFFAHHSFTKTWGYCCHYSLFYFEVTLIEETNEFCFAGIGFHRRAPKIYFHNGNLWSQECRHQKVSWKDKDVFGCGVVFPSWKENGTLPYVFFTKNGRRFGNKLPPIEDDDNLRPFFALSSCSMEINFGNNLKNKPFRYNILKHNI